MMINKSLRRELKMTEATIKANRLGQFSKSQKKNLLYILASVGWQWLVFILILPLISMILIVGTELNFLFYGFYSLVALLFLWGFFRASKILTMVSIDLLKNTVEQKTGIIWRSIEKKQNIYGDYHYIRVGTDGELIPVTKKTYARLYDGDVYTVYTTYMTKQLIGIDAPNKDVVIYLLKDEIKYLDYQKAQLKAKRK
ncbi:MAG: hypothetical protein AAF846_16250 [Chloroflexota bacterium]